MSTHIIHFRGEIKKYQQFLPYLELCCYDIFSKNSNSRNYFSIVPIALTPSVKFPVCISSG